MPQRQFANPLIISDGRVSSLYRVPFGEKSYDEAWLQELLFKHPQLIPAADLEPAINDLVPIARELPTRAGPVDLLLITPDGLITLVETKLWRNPEARRSVVAQIIDYVKEMASWSYSDLIAAIGRARSESCSDPLLPLMDEADDDFDEVTFIDAVSKNLRLGRFLLLIIGDGIREDVERMTEFLQRTPQLGFTIGLIEIGLYRTNADSIDPLFVQPRIMARTQEVTRAVVEIKVPVACDDVKVTLPDTTTGSESGRRKITEDRFFEELGKVADSTAVEFARWVLDNAGKIDLEIKWGDAGPILQYTTISGEFFTFGQLNRRGLLSSTNRLGPKCQKTEVPAEVWRDYLDELAALIPGASRRQFSSKAGRAWEQVATGSSPKKDNPKLSALAPNKDKWFAAMTKAVDRIRKALDE